jgi:endoglucanase
METMLPEGIQWATLDAITALIVGSNAYNCIRLTYAADMWTRVNRSTTARQSLLSLNLSQQVDAVNKFNPHLLDLTLIEVQTEVVRACDRANIVVLFDNQVSKPSWCCS